MELNKNLARKERIVLNILKYTNVALISQVIILLIINQ